MSPLQSTAPALGAGVSPAFAEAALAAADAAFDALAITLLTLSDAELPPQALSARPTTTMNAAIPSFDAWAGG